MYDIKPFLERLKDSYKHYYDIHEDGVWTFRAEFHSKNEGYILSKDAKLWSAEDHEYAYFISSERTGLDFVTSIVESSVEDAMNRITPGPEHRSSLITTVIITGSSDEYCRDFIRRYRYHRDFRMTLHGWVDHAIILVDTGNDRVYHNISGKSTGNMITNLMEKSSG